MDCWICGEQDKQLQWITITTNGGRRFYDRRVCRKCKIRIVECEKYGGRKIKDKQDRIRTIGGNNEDHKEEAWRVQEKN